MRELPSGWLLTPLAYICAKIVDGSHNPPKAVDSGYPMLSARNIQNRTIIFDEYRFIGQADYAVENARTQIEDGDVLLTIVGTIGRTAVVPKNTPSFCLQRSVAVLKPIAATSKFLSYALESPLVQEYLTDNAKGTAQKGIYLKALSQVEIPLAPMNEQSRIVDKLDQVLAAVDNCKARLDNIPKIIKRFRQSVLASATSGVLTADWRAENGQRSWQDVALSDICLSITDGDHQAPPQAVSGIPFITISAMNDGKLQVNKATRFVPATYYALLKPERKPVVGDILFSVTGSIAIPALVDISEPFTFQRHIAILKPDLSQISSKFLLYSLGAENITKQAYEVATGTAQLTIPLSRLRLFKIGLPKQDEQAEIVRRVEALLVVADRLEANYQSARLRVNQLTPSLLSKAFSGDLVPQDPNDEPAEMLLERIKNLKSTEPSRKNKARSYQETTPTRKNITMKIKPVNNLAELVKVLEAMGGESLPEALVTQSGLLDKVEVFYELIREGRDLKVLDVPVGTNATIRRLIDAPR